MTFALDRGIVVSSKVVDGTHVSLVKVEALVLPNMINEHKSDGTKSIVFNKLDNTTGLSKQRFKVIPNVHNERVTVYYIEKDNETYKHEYTVFFIKEDVLFPSQQFAQSSTNIIKNERGNITEVGDVKHMIRDLFEGSGIYIALFLLFLSLNGFFNNSSIDTILQKKVNYVIQIILILIFLFAGEYIIRTENSACYQNPYITEGKIDYFLAEPYVKFVDCYGHKSKSKRKNPELLGKAKNESVQIYYNHASREYYRNEDTNIYRIFTSRDAYEKESETPLRSYFGFLMLFIFVFTYLRKEKKLYVPSSISSHETKIYVYQKERQHFSELLNKVDREYYILGSAEEYFMDPVVYTENNQINIERFKLFDILLPSLIALGLLWAFFRGFGVFALDSSFSDDKIIISVIGLFGIVFLFIVIKNILTRKKVGLFDINAKKYTSFLEDITVIFDEIYAYTLTYKNVWDSDEEYKVSLYELDMVLMDGTIVNLYARKGSDIQGIYEEAKVIASCTNKPIYNFGTKDINKIFRIENYLLNTEDKEIK